jgi:hypothetical protein
MTDAPLFPIDPQTLAAWRTSLRVWLLGLLRWLLGVFGPDIRIPRDVRAEIGAELAGARAEVLDLIGMTAFARLRGAPRSGRCAPPVWTQTNRSRLCARRALTRGLLPRGRGLRGRISVLLAALRRLDALAMKVIARIAGGAKGAFRVVIDHACIDALAAPGPCACDSS